MKVILNTKKPTRVEEVEPGAGFTLAVAAGDLRISEVYVKGARGKGTSIKFSARCCLCVHLATGVIYDVQKDREVFEVAQDAPTIFTHKAEPEEN